MTNKEIEQLEKIIREFENTDRRNWFECEPPFAYSPYFVDIFLNDLKEFIKGIKND